MKFRKNVVEREYAVLVRDKATGEEEVLLVHAESEDSAVLRVDSELEVISVTEYGEE